MPTYALPQNIDLVALEKVAKTLNDLREEMCDLFPERNDVIEQLLYALIMREHVLIHGVPGTAKTLLSTMMFRAFQDAQVYDITLSRFMTESHIFGISDPKKMREEGVLEVRPEGGILVADFALLNEFLDANTAVLRGPMLDLLNEREYRRGAQQIKARLHSAVATTNSDPAERVARDSELAAVIDRFLFTSSVNSLHSVESQTKMVTQFSEGMTIKTRLPLKALTYFANIVRYSNLVTDAVLIEAYVRLVNEYKERAVELGVVISDRKMAKLTQLLEVAALMYGRLSLDIEDLSALKWGLCDPGKPEELRLFEKISGPIITEYTAKRSQSLDELQNQMIAELTRQIPQIPENCSDTELVMLAKQLAALKTKAEAIKAQLLSTQTKQSSLLSKIDSQLDEVLERIQNS